MAEILKFPSQASKLGYKRVKKRKQTAEHPDQLILFTAPTAQILELTSDLSCFEQALLLDERGDQRAAELYAKAIAEQDCVADAHCNLGIIESQRGSTIKAFDCFTTALKHDPRHGEAHYNLGNLYFDSNDFRLAQIHYEMAVEVDSSFANAYFNLALIQVINNDASAAIQTLARYQQLVSEVEGRKAAELLRTLKTSIAAARNSRLGPT
jgi:tetratricopeptide (TPR) repeat protein